MGTAPETRKGSAHESDLDSATAAVVTPETPAALDQAPLVQLVSAEELESVRALEVELLVSALRPAP